MSGQEISSKRTDLLLEWPTEEEQQSTVTKRKEELVVKIDVLKREISVDEREMKGIILFQTGRVTIHDDEVSTVLSENGKSEYTVSKRNGDCSCKDHEFAGKYGVVCKHRVADKLARDAMNKEELVTFASIM